MWKVPHVFVTYNLYVSLFFFSLPAREDRWMPADRRKRGRPKTTWRRTAEIELSEMGLTWGENQEIVKNKTWWMRIIGKLKKPQR